MTGPRQTPGFAPIDLCLRCLIGASLSAFAFALAAPDSSPASFFDAYAYAPGTSTECTLPVAPVNVVFHGKGATPAAISQVFDQATPFTTRTSTDPQAFFTTSCSGDSMQISGTESNRHFDLNLGTNPSSDAVAGTARFDVPSTELNPDGNTPACYPPEADGYDDGRARVAAAFTQAGYQTTTESWMNERKISICRSDPTASNGNVLFVRMPGNPEPLPSDIDLLRQFTPVLRYDDQEAFLLIAPSAMAEFVVTGGSAMEDDLSDIGESNFLADADGIFAVANQETAGSQPQVTWLTSTFLGAQYPSEQFDPSRRDNTPATEADHLGLRPPVGGDGFREKIATAYNDSEYMRTAELGYADVLYGRVVDGSDGLRWLQYWMFYYYNDLNFFGEFAHQGDWEMIQVGLNATTGAAVRAAYAQHNGGENCLWSAVETEDGRPEVFVGNGSHASYFHAGPGDSPTEHANGLGPALFDAEVLPITPTIPAWVGWPGHWGTGEGNNTAPTGPMQHAQQWNDPAAWAAGLDACAT